MSKRITIKQVGTLPTIPGGVSTVLLKIPDRKIGCGYCVHEHNCDAHDKYTNKAILGCPMYKPGFGGKTIEETIDDYNKTLPLITHPKP